MKTERNDALVSPPKVEPGPTRPPEAMELEGKNMVRVKICECKREISNLPLTKCYLELANHPCASHAQHSNMQRGKQKQKLTSFFSNTHFFHLPVNIQTFQEKRTTTLGNLESSYALMFASLSLSLQILAALCWLCSYVVDPPTSLAMWMNLVAALAWNLSNLCEVKLLWCMKNGDDGAPMKPMKNNPNDRL